MNVLEPGAARVAASVSADVQEAVDEVAEALGGGPFSAVVFFGSAQFSMRDLATCMHEAFPGATTLGCTTMGEVGPAGLTRGGLVAMGLLEPCEVVAVPIDLDAFLFEDGGRIVAELASRLDGAPANLAADRHVLVTLTDGLSGKEELLVASLGTHAPEVPLVGGSAGDDFRFERTWVALDGQVFSRAAVVALLAPGVPFHTFHLHHFRPCERRVVVTSADPDRRIVREIDGRPALNVLAELMEVEVEHLTSNPIPAASPAQVGFAFRVSGQYFLRTIMRVHDDALWMGGAVEEGSVLQVMRPGDLVEETRAGVRRALAEVGDPTGLLLFHCGGRQIEAESTGVTPQLWEAMCPTGVASAGFTTYGEQYGPVQICSTLTGLVLGRRDG